MIKSAIRTAICGLISGLIICYLIVTAINFINRDRVHKTNKEIVGEYSYPEDTDITFGGAVKDFISIPMIVFHNFNLGCVDGWKENHIQSIDVGGGNDNSNFDTRSSIEDIKIKVWTMGGRTYHAVFVEDIPEWVDK